MSCVASVPSPSLGTRFTPAGNPAHSQPAELHPEDTPSGAESLGSCLAGVPSKMIRVSAGVGEALKEQHVVARPDAVGDPSFPCLLNGSARLTAPPPMNAAIVDPKHL
jgi:hypothetical protein